MPLTTKFDTLDILAPPIGAVAWLFLSWLYARAVSLGRPLNRVQKGMIVYGFLFVLGMGYLLMFGGALHWQKVALFLSVALWGGLVAAVAWWRYRKAKTHSMGEQHPPLSER